MDPESIVDKRAFCEWGIDIIVSILMSHRNKIWYMENHETLTEASHLFGSMYNPIKHFFDMYLDVEMPSTYKDCKFIMKYREYMRWQLVYYTSDLEVACRHLKTFVKHCIRYKRLDLLSKIVSKVKKTTWKILCTQWFLGEQNKEIKYKQIKNNAFWENKIKK